MIGFSRRAFVARSSMLTWSRDLLENGVPLS
jgi:hypothetical protein